MSLDINKSTMPQSTDDDVFFQGLIQSMTAYARRKMGLTREASIDTGLYAACCSYLSDGSLLCGTYQLQDDSVTTSEGCRLGSLLHLSHGPDGREVKLKTKMPSSGVLDIQVKDSIVAVMLADGTVTLLHLPSDADADRPEQIGATQQDVSVVSDGLCLAGAWSSDSRLAISDSRGGISIVMKNESSFAVSMHKAEIHQYEVWSVCWDSNRDDVLYTGADDSLLKMHDLRTGGPVMTVKGHDAGVTSIVSPSSMEHTLITGSYDECIRCWDKRMWKSSTGSLKLGGGVWRIKANPEEDALLACACMQDGARIVRLSESGFVVEEAFMQDRKLVYGIDWCPRTKVVDEDPIIQAQIVSACSFYDHVLDTYSYLPAKSTDHQNSV